MSRFRQYLYDMLVRLLWLQVKRYRAKHKPVVIAVVGSVGKSTTRYFIETILKSHLKTTSGRSDYHDELTIPLTFFGQKKPHDYNIFGWLKVLLVSELRTKAELGKQAVVVEIKPFVPKDCEILAGRLDEVDYLVMTSITNQSSDELFEDDVFSEELKPLFNISKNVIASESIDSSYIEKNAKLGLFGKNGRDCSYDIKSSEGDFRATFTCHQKIYKADLKLVNHHQIDNVAAAVLLANRLELRDKELTRGLAQISPLSGRSELRLGKADCEVIDETGHNNPIGITQAIEAFSQRKAGKRILILGEIPGYHNNAKSVYETIAGACDPNKLELVITVGDRANDHLAKAVEKRGCHIMRCPTPDHALDVAERLITKNTSLIITGRINRELVNSHQLVK